MPEHSTTIKGGTMRLGSRASIFNTKKSVLRKLYGDCETVKERHRHRYEVNPDYVSDLEGVGCRFVARDETGRRMEMLELEGHPYFVSTQFHPEYLSRPLKPSPPFLGLILASSGCLEEYLEISGKPE